MSVGGDAAGGGDDDGDDDDSERIDLGKIGAFSTDDGGGDGDGTGPEDVADRPADAKVLDTRAGAVARRLMEDEVDGSGEDGTFDCNDEDAVDAEIDEALALELLTALDARLPEVAVVKGFFVPSRLRRVAPGDRMLPPPKAVLDEVDEDDASEELELFDATGTRKLVNGGVRDGEPAGTPDGRVEERVDVDGDC